MLFVDTLHAQTCRILVTKTTPLPDRVVSIGRRYGITFTQHDVMPGLVVPHDGILIGADVVWFPAVAQVEQWVKATDAAVIVWMREPSTALRVAAYDQGAADVLPPDVDPAEFAVRVRAAVQRVRRRATPQTVNLAATFGAITVVPSRRVITTVHGTVTLTGLQWQILNHLIVHLGVAQSHAALVRAVWGCDDDAAARHTLRTHISALRRRLDLRPDALVSVHGYGYVLHEKT
jgi:DNA-binding response OmpR family regulator